MVGSTKPGRGIVAKFRAAIFVSNRTRITKPDSGSANKPFSIIMLAAMILNTLAAGAPALMSQYAAAQTANPQPLAAEALQGSAKAAEMAADTKLDKSKAKAMPEQLQNKLENDRAQMLAGKSADRKHVKLLDEGRSETDRTFLNADGTKSLVRTFDASSFKDGNGKWQEIDAGLSEEKSSGKWRSGNNVWNAAFDDSATSAVEVNKDGQVFRFSPIGANSVKPVITGAAPNQVVTYRNVWQGIDLEYRVSGSQVKESIIVKSKAAATEYAFKTSGAGLRGNGKAGSFSLDGAFSNFEISAPSVDTKDGKSVTDTKPVSQQAVGSQLTVSVDPGWLKNLDTEAFPVVIDPTIVYNSGTNFSNVRSDTGLACTGAACPGNAVGKQGSVNWRTIYQTNFGTDLVGKFPVYAELHLELLSGATTASNVSVNRASCTNAFACYDQQWGEVTASVGSVANIDVTPIYRSAVGEANYNPAVMLRGVETGGTDTYKLFDYTKTTVTVTFEALPSQPAISAGSPASGGVSINTQPTFFSTASTDSDGPNTLLYRYVVGTSGSTPSNDPFHIQQGVSGVVADSGQNPATQWTVFDSALREGVTYSWQIAVWDGYAGAPEVFSPVYTFKVDLRTGKDATQSYDSIGPFSTDLASGNVYTTAKSHSISALGGDLGVNLEYNSPLRSRQGLIGEYYSDPNATRSFTGTNVAKTFERLDPSIKFDWGSNSPYPGLLDVNNFLVRWSGYFVAPQDGTYQFGTTSDDGVRIFINDAAYLDQWAANPNDVYGSGIALTAGQTAKVVYEYFEGPGLAYTNLKVKTTNGSIAPQVVQSGWLQTGVRPITQNQGLIGRYFTDDGTHTFPANLDDPNRIFLTRTDTSLTQNWGSGSPVPNGPSELFMARWTGWITAPITGNYTFGTYGDDGSRVYLDGSGTPLINNWSTPTGNPVYASGSTLMTAGVPRQITIEYYENSGLARFSLLLKRPGQPQSLTDPSVYQVESKWLSTQAQVLPDGWNLNLDAAGDLNYSYARINQNSVTLIDAIGQAHEYVFKNGFTPPAGENGYMVRNADGTITLQDSDGYTYVFGLNGTLISVTAPADDRNPAALKYSYGGTPVHLQQITDAVDQSRWVKIAYTGNPTNACPAPAATANAAPTGMVCGVTTSDGQITKFGYVNDGNSPVVPRLARLEYPGGEIIDYGYEATSGRINRFRDGLAYEAVSGGQRTGDNSVLYEVSYDSLGRVSQVTMPAATTGAARMAHSYNYYQGNTYMRIAGAAEPNGFSRKIAYDATQRTNSDTDTANQVSQTEWHATKDLVLSITDPATLKTTSIYDYADRLTDTYGPAPASWFNPTTRLPLTTPTNYTPQVPHSQTGYDESINGLAAAYYNVNSYTNGTGQAAKALFGSPKLHATGVGPANGDIVKTWGASQPITPDNNPSGGTYGWGLSLSGWIHLTAAGNHTFRVTSDDGVRLWIDDSQLLDDWLDGPRTHPSKVYSNTSSPADSWHRIRLDTYNKAPGGALEADANLTLYMTAPGGGETSALGGILKPGYGLATTQKTYDSSTSVGETVTSISYGANPELGLAQTSTVDPGGLNLVTTNTYEAPGAGSFLRQTAKYLPGANTATASTATRYTYYGATETRDNPCTTGTTEAYKQAGRLKIATEPDPDGAGAQTPVTTETIYDDAGRVVATRFNTESWRCSTYDSRGRISQLVIPAQTNTPHVTRSARTITYSYNSGGSWGPFQTSISDSGAPIGPDISTISDLLGRITSYNENQNVSGTIYGHATNYSYDSLGRLSTKVSGAGTFVSPITESFTYNNVNRLSGYLQNGTTYAVPSYDTYGRLNGATYPAAGALATTIGRDSLGRTNSLSYTIRATSGATPTQLSDNVTLSQSGQPVSGTENGAAKTYTYDKASRLTNATLGSNSFAYNFGSPSACTGTYNTNAGKNSNRTSSTINGVTKTYCYDYADRLISSNDTNNFDTVTYDAHGNISSGSLFTKLEYDSSDRAIYLSDMGGTQTTKFDAADRVNYSAGCSCYYTYGSAGSAPNWAFNSGGSPSAGFFALAGGVTLTNKVSMLQLVYSLPNLHGDTMATTDNAGVLTSPTGTFQYDPFGKVLGSGGFNNPSNGAGSDSVAYVGQHGKLTDTNTSNSFMQMGARLYIPTLGRFAQTDPVDGGTENNYLYPSDPVNNMDLNGEWIETAYDIASFGYSANEFRKNKTIGNFAWAAYDGVSIFVPLLPGSLAARGGFKALKAARAAKALKITFKTEHAARHLPKGLAIEKVEKAISGDIKGMKKVPDGWSQHDIKVGGFTIRYRMYKLDNGTINIGTYFPI